MTVYLAASFSRIKEVKQIAKDLESLGLSICSSWVNEISEDWTPKNADTKPHSLRMSIAMRDVADINKSDALVLFAEDPYQQPPRGGRHWEVGYAYGRGKKVLIVGKPENVFHHLPDVELCADWEAAKTYLLSQKYAREKRSILNPCSSTALSY